MRWLHAGMRKSGRFPYPHTRMFLLPITAETAAAPRVTQSEFLSGICAATLGMAGDGAPPAAPWIGYLAQDGEAGDAPLVGTCAFKSPPDADGVEIAYFTFPGHEGRGVASRMAALLVDLAAAHGVTRIRAQTLPESNASTRVLQKLGFTCAGPVMHPDDGEVWEWRRG